MTITEIYQTRDIKVSDIKGLWEIIRIDKDDDDHEYPWIKGRYMLNFLEEMLFVCIRGEEHTNGTWKLSDTARENRTFYSITLNDSTEYLVLYLDEDEMVLSDRTCKYLLSRKF